MSVFLLYVMLNEMFWGILMNGLVTGAWRFDVLSGLPNLLYGLILVGLVLLFTQVLRVLWMKVLASAAIAGLLKFAVKPLIGFLFASVMKAAAPLDHADLYPFP